MNPLFFFFFALTSEENLLKVQNTTGEKASFFINEMKVQV